MRFVRALLRQILVWWLPCIAGLAFVVAAFLGWALGTQAGTTLLLRTAASQFDGEVAGIRGSVLRGLWVDTLRLSLPGAAVDLEKLHLQVEWGALAARTLRVRDLSMASLRVELAPADADDEDDEGGGPIALPVGVKVDRLALGRFELVQDGQPLPVTLGDLLAGASLDASGLAVDLDSLAVGHDVGHVRLQGTARVDELRDPWPMAVALSAAIQGTGPGSPLCELQEIPGVAQARPEASCSYLLDLDVNGSLESLKIAARAEGSGLRARAGADVAVREAIPVRHAELDVELANGGGLDARVDWEAVGEPGAGRERLRGTLSARRFDLGAMLAGLIPDAVLSAEGDFSAELAGREALLNAALGLKFGEGTVWNGRPLSGHLAATVAGGVRPDGSEDGVTTDWTRLRIPKLDADLKLGRNQVRAQGGFGGPQAALSLDVQAPELAAFWPGLPGGASLKGKVGGSVAKHEAELEARYEGGPADARALGQAPASARVSLEGGWGKGAGEAPADALEGWRGRLRQLQAEHAGIALSVPRPVDAQFLPAAQAPLWQWRAGAASLALTLPGKHAVQIEHGGSRGGPGRWETAGRIDNLVVTGELVRDIRRLADPGFESTESRSGVKVTASSANLARSIGLDVAWDLKFNGALGGTARIARRAGDLAIPADPPIPLGLRDLTLDVKATPTGGGASRIEAALNVLTEKMGRLRGTGSAVLVAGEGGAMGLAPRQPIRAAIDADIDDLAWVGLFTGDSLDVGGSLRANVEAQGTLGGEWRSRGTVTGKGLRVVRIDDGIRLLDGTLSMRLEDDLVVLESLRFPAVLRVTPNEWRTREWITQNPDAQGGELRASGSWNLARSAGDVRVVLHRFPILQRSDRYAMMSGAIDLKAELPAVSITGGVVADAGWVSAEILSSVPRVDDDVIVARAGDEVRVPAGMQVSMDIKVGLGPRFYLTGMGIDSGLVGDIQVILDEGRLTGVGAFRTRGGRFEAYGQRLHLRRGTITFQENIANPLLDIEALRLGEQVEAGVRVGGTAQRPRIDLVSYPDVSDVEKLSWLILGRGPDQSGSDAALLLSLGASLIGGGEPFYRRLGLDDVGIKSGAMGSSGSLLPDTTVASSVARTTNTDLETQFMVASKRFANGVTLSVEQALSGTDTVGRASYRLARGLSLDLKAGAVNGLELVYRVFWGN